MGACKKGDDEACVMNEEMECPMPEGRMELVKEGPKDPCKGPCDACEDCDEEDDNCMAKHCMNCAECHCDEAGKMCGKCMENEDHSEMCQEACEGVEMCK